jgi:hypothetical protein
MTDDPFNEGFPLPDDPLESAVTVGEICAVNGHLILQGHVNDLELVTYCGTCTRVFRIFLERAIQLAQVEVAGPDGMKIAQKSAAQVLEKWRAEGAPLSQ